MISHVNPAIIRWGRKRINLSLEDLADSMKCSPDVVANWESGATVPSYSHLEDLSNRCLKLPLAVFFFPNPPVIDEPAKKFRRLPDYELARLSPDSIHSVHLAQAYQDSLHDLVPEIAFSKRLLTEEDLNSSNVESVAKSIRSNLGITIEQQQDFRGAESAFKAWRHALEKVGVFTFKDSLKDRFISGFCLLDAAHPIVFVNNSNAFSRQVFTLFHELGHILSGIHGITDTDETYLEFMSSDDKQLEVTCNKLAAEVLVPKQHFKDDIVEFKATGIDAIGDIASKYCVSREVILRKLLDCKEISLQTYTTLSAEWNKDYLRTPKPNSKGNYYLTKLSYLGEGFAKLAFSQYDKGNLTISELANHLNVKSKNIDKLQTYLG